VQRAEIYDMIGRIISSNAVTNNSTDLSSLKTGTYILKIHTINGIATSKIIKQ